MTQTIDTEAVMVALRTRALTALPATRVWENTIAKPGATTVYVTDALAPNGGALLSLNATGLEETDFLYLLTYVGIAGGGTPTINATLDAVLALFRAGSYVTATDGTVVRVRGKPLKPSRSQITNPPSMPGRAVSVITIPVRVLTSN